MASCVLAIDQGTTGTKALVVDDKGTITGRAYAELRRHYPRPGWVEQDPEDIWQVTLKVIGAALADAGTEARGLNALGITNQRETVVMWERATGRPVGNAIVWQDRRTAPVCDELRNAGHEESVADRTGLLLDSYFSGTKVAWLLDNVDGLRSRAQHGEIAFGTVDSWLVHKLTGGKLHVTDYTNASRTLLYDIFELDWSDELLEMLRVPAALLPEVLPSSHICAHTDPDVFFGARVPIAGLAGDQQASLFAQACFEEGLAKNTYGTGSFVLMHTGSDALKSSNGLLSTIAWRIGDEPVEYALEGAVFVTGAALQWLRDGLGIIEHAGETASLAASVDGNEDVFFVPALTGLGAPHWDPHARGALLGLTQRTTKAHVARAALESIAYQTRDVVEAMERDSNVTLKELRADGGAVANRWLMQFQADILGVSVLVPQDTATTALGSAYLAGLATGFWQDRTELDALWTAQDRYEPALPEAERDRLYRRWQDALQRSFAWESH